MEQIVYPISLGYRPDQGHWEVVRELVSNAMDNKQSDYAVDRLGEFRHSLPQFRDIWGLHPDNSMVIYNDKAFATGSLVIGVTEGPSDARIGQFGEGLKIALLIATRLGQPVYVYSGGLLLRNVKQNYLGAEVMALEYSENEINVGDNTIIVLPEWDWWDWQGRFVTEVDSRVVFSSENNIQILDEGEYAALYHKGVYVKDLNTRFSYNVQKSKISLEREIADPDQMWREIGDVWTEVGQESLWIEFFKALKDDRDEINIKFPAFGFARKQIKHPEVVLAAFRNVYGENAILAADEDSAQYAAMRGMVSIMFSWGIKEALSKAIPTSQDFLEEEESRLRTIKRPTMANEKTRLKALRKLAKQALPDKNVIVESYGPHASVSGKPLQAIWDTDSQTYEIAVYQSAYVMSPVELMAELISALATLSAETDYEFSHQRKAALLDIASTLILRKEKI